MTRPRYSVIVPSFNQADVLERTLRSAAAQGGSGPDACGVELLVADGGSTDGTIALLERLDQERAAHRATWWSTAWDGGPAEAANTALRHATGDFVVVLHASDVLLPKALADAAEAMQAVGDVCPKTGTVGAAWAVGQIGTVDTDGSPLPTVYAEAPASLSELLKAVEPAARPGACVFRRGVLERLGGFDPRLQFVPHLDLGCRALAAGLLPVAVDRELARRCVRPTSATALHTIEANQERLMVAFSHIDRLPLAEQEARRADLLSQLSLLERAEADSDASFERSVYWAEALREPTWLNAVNYRAELTASSAGRASVAGRGPRPDTLGVGHGARIAA